MPTSLRRLLPVLLASLLPLAACVGDDPSPSPVAPGQDAGTTPTTPTTPSDGGTQSDGATSCPTGFAECDGDPTTVCETDTRTSAAHCGSCGRACGGTATCQAGQCSAERVHDGLDRPYGLAVAGPRLVWYEGTDAIRGCRTADCKTSTAILADIPTPSLTPDRTAPRQIAVDGAKFYISACPAAANVDCRTASCDVTGCKFAGPTYLSPADGRRRSPLVVGGPGAIYTFNGLDGTYRTAIGGGGATQINALYKTGDSVQSMHVDATRFVYLDENASLVNPTGGVFLCPIAGCPGAPTLLIPPPVKHLAFASDTVFASGGVVAGTASILSCAVSGCGGAGTVLATSQAYVSDIAADAKAVYWATTGTPNVLQNSAAIGTVMRCDLPACAGGPVKVADAVTNPINVRIDDEYVYWLTVGTPASQNGEIWRRRR